MSDYKAAKEAFVADNPGSSVHYVNIVSLTAFTSYALYACAARRIRGGPVFDWLITVLPLLLSVTILSDRALLFNGAIAAAAFVAWLASPAPVRVPKPHKPMGRWLAESDSEDDTAPAPSATHARLIAVKLPSQVYAENRAQERAALASSVASSVGSPTSLEPGHNIPRRRASPSPQSPGHTIDIPTSAQSSPEVDRHEFSSEKHNAAQQIPILQRPTSRAEREAKEARLRVPRTSGGSALLPFLSMYRAHMMVMTVHCILAVDFPVFPRVLGKCETFGTSLMDMGVGSFVFSLGIVSSRTFSPDAYRRSWGKALVKSVRSTAPVLALGLVRLIMVKGTDYPEHVTEYGVHWNFFFTLGLVPALATVLLPLRRFMRWGTCGLLITAIHQLALSTTQLQTFVLSPGRPGLLGANKEGLASLPGYLAIFLLGLSVGDRVLRVASPRPIAGETEEGSATGAPSADEDRTAERATKRRTELALDLAGYAAMSWAALAGCCLLDWTGLASTKLEVSRQLANLPYVVWTAAYNATALGLYLLLDLGFFPPGADKTTGAKACPPLLEAINRNGLAIFLVSNLLTGLVNLSMQTMYASTSVSMAVLMGYSAAVCGIAWLLRRHRLKI